MTIVNCLLLLMQSLLYFGVMAALFRLRDRVGLGLFICALGVMHFLENYLASVFYIALPFGVFSPGSTVLFSGKLVMLLLLYIKEDAATVRQPIYGLLIGNLLLVTMIMILRQHEIVPPRIDTAPDISFIDQVGWLMVWGTLLLFIDSFAIIMLYERLGAWFRGATVTRLIISACAVLTFDQIGFIIPLHFLAGADMSVFVGGWVAKMGAAVVFSILLATYLRRFEPPFLVEGMPLNDLFNTLTYRERYEDLVRRSGHDSLTGLLHRGRFEEMGRRAVTTAVRDRTPLALLVIDVDNFKGINDRRGHVAGDKVLSLVAARLRNLVGPTDYVFRLGGDELAVLTPQKFEAARHLAERIRHDIEQGTRHDADPVTVSIGIGTVTQEVTTLPDLYMAADSSLYSAKSGGRNRVGAAMEPAE